MSGREKIHRSVARKKFSVKHEEGHKIRFNLPFQDLFNVETIKAGNSEPLLKFEGKEYSLEDFADQILKKDDTFVINPRSSKDCFVVEIAGVIDKFYEFVSSVTKYEVEEVKYINLDSVWNPLNLEDQNPEFRDELEEVFESYTPLDMNKAVENGVEEDNPYATTSAVLLYLLCNFGKDKDYQRFKDILKFVSGCNEYDSDYDYAEEDSNHPKKETQMDIRSDILCLELLYPVYFDVRRVKFNEFMVYPCKGQFKERVKLEKLFGNIYKCLTQKTKQSHGKFLLCEDFYPEDIKELYDKEQFKTLAKKGATGEIEFPKKENLIFIVDYVAENSEIENPDKIVTLLYNSPEQKQLNDKFLKVIFEKYALHHCEKCDTVHVEEDTNCKEFYHEGEKLKFENGEYEIEEPDEVEGDCIIFVNYSCCGKIPKDTKGCKQKEGPLHDDDACVSEFVNDADLEDKYHFKLRQT